MKILIDCRFAGGKTGLGRYSREIAAHLVKGAKEETYTLIVRSGDEPRLEELKGLCKIVEADIPHYSLAEQTRMPRIIASARPDVLFSPHFNVPIFNGVPFVATVHDLILHRHPGDASFAKRIAYRALIGSCVRRARKLIAISEFTAGELKTAYGENVAQKTIVVREGVDEHFFPRSGEEIARVRALHRIDRPYFLYVGSAKRHKNVPLLIDAFKRSGRTDADLILVTGGDEARALEPLPTGVRFAHPVADEDLPALYSGALAAVTASIYEGYCLPVAEALACAAPVIATNMTAIPETAAGHATLLPADVDAFAAAFRDPPTDRTPFIAGRWEQTAEGVRKILLDALR